MPAVFMMARNDRRALPAANGRVEHDAAAAPVVDGH